MEKDKETTPDSVAGSTGTDAAESLIAKLDAMSKLHETALALDLTVYLSEAQQGALKLKIGNTVKTDLVKETGVPLGSLILAYYVTKARKEANDSIFSAQRTALFYECLNTFMGLVSEAEPVVEITQAKLDSIIERCGGEEDSSRLKTLVEMVKANLLKGRTAIPEEKLPAFKKLAEYFGVDVETTK